MADEAAEVVAEVPTGVAGSETAPETPTGGTTESTKQPPEAGVTDWRVRYEAEVPQLQKQISDLRSHQIAAMTQRERETLLSHLPSILKTQNLILQSLKDGVPEDLDAQIATIEGESEEAIADREFDGQVNSVAAEVWRIGESLGLNPNVAPEFKIAKQYFDYAQANGDPFFLGQAVAEAERASAKIQAERHKQELSKAKGDAQKRAREEAGVMDLSGGKEVPGVGLPVATRENIDRLWVAYEREHPDSANPYDKAYRQFVATGKVA